MKKPVFLRTFFSFGAVLLSLVILALSVCRVSVWSVEMDEVKKSLEFELGEASGSSESQEMVAIGGREEEKVDYYLAYPGVLPDSPWYFLKVIRDRIWLFLTTRPIRKAEVLLLFGDKRMAAASELSLQGKGKLAALTALKAEGYLEKAFAIWRNLAEGKEKEALEKQLRKAGEKYKEMAIEMKEKENFEDLEEVIYRLEEREVFQD